MYWAVHPQPQGLPARASTACQKKEAIEGDAEAIYIMSKSAVQAAFDAAAGLAMAIVMSANRVSPIKKMVVSTPRDGHKGNKGVGSLTG
jgi:hypothetical protein